MRVHTLGVQVVLDRNGVVLLDGNGLLGALSQWVPGSGVFLFEVLDLVLKRECLLFDCSAMRVWRRENRVAGCAGTDHLLLEGNFLDLHLVHSSRLGGGAKDCVTRASVSMFQTK